MSGELVVTLRRAAHARAGDKGNRANIAVIAYHAALYEPIVAQITQELVAAHFAFRRPARVTRYLLPKLHALNFVLDDVLDGGVNDTLNLDAHGKTLAFHLLALPLRVPKSLIALLRGPTDDPNVLSKEIQERP
ncbi:MAG: hypothetical protein RMK97_00110 [Sutterellaceae bacterium]|nr:hypothetical protein [Burkholderiaceae bacterium]MCX7901426.1 hypothetical protein [Burkholderiaceae bacterium]MDW8428905.1 hypothetical protein [Sutterellaceae bacterium]